MSAHQISKHVNPHIIKFQEARNLYSTDRIQVQWTKLLLFLSNHVIRIRIRFLLKSALILEFSVK